MVVRVLVVDDSRFFRRRVTEMLEQDSRIKVIGTAENGKDAVEKASRLRPDVITMDIEMPVMDGITATKKILATQKIPILMFSSLTTEGAQTTLDALDAGAVDYLPKRFEEISKDKLEAKQMLCERVLSVVRHRVGATTHHISTPSVITPPKSIVTPVRNVTTHNTRFRTAKLNLVAIGTSTGGPVALQTVLSKLPGSFPCPILLIQHMPGSFTGAFARRLDTLCNISVKEAEDRDEIKAGQALLAPGGQQMSVEKLAGRYVVRIKPSSVSENYKPCVDLTFKSIASSGIGNVLGIILTGMGADGCAGARELKKMGALMWAQSEATCVVAGMPSAVIDAGLTDSILSLEDIGQQLAQRS